jgi:hypothetical protein
MDAHLMSETIIIYDARVINPVTYPSGNVALNVGDKIKVSKRGNVFFLYSPERLEYDECRKSDFVWSTNSLDWMLEHLVCEGL